MHGCLHTAIIRLYHYTKNKIRPLTIDVAWSVCVCVSVCLLDTSMSPAKTDEPIVMLFELCTRVQPRNHVLGGGPDPLRGRGDFQGCSAPLEMHSNRQSAEKSDILAYNINYTIYIPTDSIWPHQYMGLVHLQIQIVVF